MSPIHPLWTNRIANGYRDLDLRTGCRQRDLETRLHQTELVDRWLPMQMNWDPSNNAKKPGLTTLGVPWKVCLSEATRHDLFGQDTGNLEFLPLDVDGGPWYLVNCLRQAASFDANTALRDELDLGPELPPLVRGLKWVCVTDPAANALELFTIPSASTTQLIWSDTLVRRVRSLNIEGLEFDPVGYIVHDASLAVPMPARQEPPAKAKRVARKQTVSEVAPLSKMELKQRDAARAAAMAWNTVSESTRAKSQLSALKARIEGLKANFSNLDEDAQIDALTQLGASFGDLVCEQAGWTWAALRHGRDLRWWAVVSKDGQQAIALAPLLRRQIESDDWTLPLLLNMILAGQLPAPRQGQVNVLQ